MIMAGVDPAVPDATVRGVNFRWLHRFTLQLTDAPVWYSQRARLLGELCPLCDLELPAACECPPALFIGRGIKDYG